MKNASKKMVKISGSRTRLETFIYRYRGYTIRERVAGEYKRNIWPWACGSIKDGATGLFLRNLSDAREWIDSQITRTNITPSAADIAIVAPLAATLEAMAAAKILAR